MPGEVPGPLGRWPIPADNTLVNDKRKDSRLRNALLRFAITLAAVGLFSLLRFDVAAMAWTKAESFAVSNSQRYYRTPAIIEDYLKNATDRKLHLGAGGFNKPGWLNTDIEPLDGQAFLDVTQRFPLPDRSFRIVFSEHLIEHVSYEEGLGMLKESFRVLQPGGKVRVTTPDLLKFIGLFEEKRTAERQAYLRQKWDFHSWPATPDENCFVLNMELREWGHRFVYTPRMLRASMESAGFTQIRQFTAGESDDPTLRRVEARSNPETARAVVIRMNEFETMSFEGVRP